MEGDIGFWSLVFVCFIAGVFVIWLVWQVVRSFPLAGILIGFVLAGYGVWKVDRDFSSAKRPYFDSVKKEFARFQEDPKINPLDSTWRSYRILKRHGKVDVYKGLLQPGDYFWVCCYDALRVWAFCEEESSSTKNVVFIQYRVTENSDLFLGTSSTVGKNYVYNGIPENVFVKVWRKPRTLMEGQKTELYLWLIGGGLGLVIGVIGLLLEKKPKVVDEGKVYKPEVLSEVQAGRLFAPRSHERRDEPMIELPGTFDIDAIKRDLFRYSPDRNVFEFYVEALVTRFKADQQIKRVLLVIKTLGVEEQFYAAVEKTAKKKWDAWAATALYRWNQQIAEKKKEVELKEQEANLKDQELRIAKTDKAIRELQEESEQSKADSETRRINGCHSVLTRYRVRLLAVQGILLSDHYDRLLQNSELKALHQDFLNRTEIITSLENRIQQGAQPFELEDEIREILRSAESGDSDKGRTYKQAYSKANKAAAEESGIRNQVLDQTERLKKECKEREQEVDAKVLRGEIDQEEGEKEKQEFREFYNQKIMQLKMAIS